MHYAIIIAFWAGIPGDAIINPSMIVDCIRCKTKLIPVVYGRLDKDILDMQDKGLLLVGLDKARGANSFCPLCEESYVDYTNAPDLNTL